MVTTQAYGYGNARFHISCAWISRSSGCIKATDRRKLVAKREFNNPTDKHVVKVVRGNETVGHLPPEFSRIAWYFLARSGKSNVEVIGRRRHCKQLCGGMELLCQLEFNCSNRTTGEQDSGFEPEDPNLLLKAVMKNRSQYV